MGCFAGHFPSTSLQLFLFSGQKITFTAGGLELVSGDDPGCNLAYKVVMLQWDHVYKKCLFSAWLCKCSISVLILNNYFIIIINSKNTWTFSYSFPFIFYSFPFPITADTNRVFPSPLDFSNLNQQNISRSFRDLDNLIESSVISRLCYYWKVIVAWNYSIFIQCFSLQYLYPVSLWSLELRLANYFCKGPGSEYFRLYGPGCKIKDII